LVQAKLKGNTPEADRLFAEASQKLAEVVRIKPDKHETYFNLACLSALRGDLTGAIAQLEFWAKYKPGASKSDLDNDPDFDRIRNAPEFLGLRDRLPG